MRVLLLTNKQMNPCCKITSAQPTTRLSGFPIREDYSLLIQLKLMFSTVLTIAEYYSCVDQTRPKFVKTSTPSWLFPKPTTPTNWRLIPATLKADLWVFSCAIHPAHICWKGRGDNLCHGDVNFFIIISCRGRNCASPCCFSKSGCSTCRGDHYFDIITHLLYHDHQSP